MDWKSDGNNAAQVHLLLGVAMVLGFRPGKLATRCGWIMGSAAGSDKLIHELELALVPDLMDVGTSQFLQVTDAHNARILQLGAKFIF